MTWPALPKPQPPPAGAATHGGVDWRAVFAFPNPVNEYAARITARLVVVVAVATLLTGWAWGLVTLAVV